MSRVLIRRFEPQDARDIRLRDIDKKDLAGCDMEWWAAHWASFPIAYTMVFESGEIVGCGGVTRCPWPGEASAWTLTTDHVAVYGKSFSKGILNGIGLAEKDGVKRFTCYVLPENIVSQRWVEWMGFRREGLCAKCGPNALDRYIYARVRQ